MPHSPLTRKLIAEGCEPASVRVPASLYEAFFAAAVDSLTKGAPGIAEPTRNALARSIAMKCERAAKTWEQAA